MDVRLKFRADLVFLTLYSLYNVVAALLSKFCQIKIDESAEIGFLSVPK